MANTADTNQGRHARHQSRDGHKPQGKALQVNENSVQDPSPRRGPEDNRHDQELEGNSLQVNENSEKPKNR